MHDQSSSIPTPRRRAFMNRSPFTPVSPHIIRDESHSASSDEMLIYGTTIDQQKLFQKFKNFVREFEVGPERIRIYSQQVRKLFMSDTMNTQSYFEIKVSGKHIHRYDIELYSQIVHYPVEVIITMDQVFSTLYLEMQGINPDIQTPETQRQRICAEHIVTEVYDMMAQSSIRKLNPQKQINHLISLKGFVTRCSELIPEMKKAEFKCSYCKFNVSVDLVSSRIDQPSTCPNCAKTHTMELIHSQSIFTDKQIVKLQELPQSVPQSQTPLHITLIAFDNNADKLRPGDKVEVVGIYRAIGRRVVRNQRTVHSVYQTHLDLISAQLLNKNQFKNQDEGVSFSQQQIRQFHMLANTSNLYQNLISSVAPNIWELESVKKGVLCQIFGGSRKNEHQPNKVNRQGIHILLVGDPSTAKSQILKYVSNVAPRVIYSTGRGSSAMGLTAAVSKDPETGQFILQSGALVLADKGICCLDQFDKMNQSSKTVLLESMQQQTISVAKAGIVCQLNARTSILAAANPIKSMYDPKKTVVENINMPVSLLARFDLIYILIDRPDKQRDYRLANHILSLFSLSSKSKDTAAPIPRKLLTNYISYAKKYVNPIITKEVSQRIIAHYVEMRKVGISRKIVSATPRQLESIIRISQAFARMRLSPLVQFKDVDQAVALIKDALMQAATNPDTGNIDIDSVLLGTGQRAKERQAKISETLRLLITNNADMFEAKGMVFMQLLQQVRARRDDDSITEEEMLLVLKKLQDQNLVVLLGNKKKRPSIRLASMVRQ